MIRDARETELFGRLFILAIGFALSVPAAAEDVDRHKDPRAIVASIDANGRVVPMAYESHVAVDASPGTGPHGPASPACPTVSRLSKSDARALVLSLATRENFFPDFVVAVAEIESHFDAAALSPKGAYGLMQLEPETARRYSVDFCDPAANVLGGIRYLRYLHDRYKNPMFILSAYNAGEAAILRAHGVPSYPETVRFVADVLNAFYDWPRPEAAAPASAIAAPNRPMAGSILQSFGDALPGFDPSATAGEAAEVRHWD